MIKLRGVLITVALFLGAVGIGVAAVTIPNFTISSGCNEASQLLACMNQIVGQMNSGTYQQGVLPQLGPTRNLLDNGAMLVQQRGTGTATAATTAGCAIASYAADRWCADVNVSSGAGQLTPITSTPTPPVGFSQALKMVRSGGALTQPQCVWQEIRTADVVPLQGQTVVASVFVQALAGLAADQGAATQTANLVLITGTGTDQGLGALRSAVGMTASPAITPAWTGIATLQNTTLSLPVTPAWQRFTATPIAVPTNVTEMAYGVCFTPTAAGQSATDGIAFTGAQLEVGQAASAFEFRPIGFEQTKVQRYFTTLPEPGTGVAVPVHGTAISATVSNSAYPFPVTMDIAPTFQVFGNALSGTTWTLSNAAVNNALATTFIVTKTANTPQAASLTITTSGMTAGSGTILLGANGGNILTWSADF